MYFLTFIVQSFITCWTYIHHNTQNKSKNEIQCLLKLKSFQKSFFPGAGNDTHFSVPLFGSSVTWSIMASTLCHRTVPPCGKRLTRPAVMTLASSTSAALWGRYRILAFKVVTLVTVKRLSRLAVSRRVCSPTYGTNKHYLKKILKICNHKFSQTRVLLSKSHSQISLLLLNNK